MINPLWQRRRAAARFALGHERSIDDRLLVLEAYLLVARYLLGSWVLVGTEAYALSASARAAE